MRTRVQRLFAFCFSLALIAQSALTIVAPLPASAQAAPGYNTGTRPAFGDYASAVSACAKYKDAQLSPAIPGVGGDAVVRLDSLYNSQSHLPGTFYMLPNSPTWNYPGAGATFYCYYDAVMSGWKNRDNPSLATVVVNASTFFNNGAGTTATTTLNSSTSFADAERLCDGHGAVVWQLTQLTHLVAQYMPNQQFTTFYAQRNDPGWENHTFGDQYQCAALIPTPNMQYYTLLQNTSYGKALQCVGGYNSCDAATKAIVLYYCSTNPGQCPASVVKLLSAKSEAEFNAALAQVMPAAAPPPPVVAPPAPPPPGNVPAPGYSTDSRKAFASAEDAIAYCPQHFTPGSIARTDGQSHVGATIYYYYASANDHSPTWTSGGPTFYCLYDVVMSGWKSADGKTFQVAQGGSGQSVAYNGGLNALQAFDAAAQAQFYCAQHFNPNDVVRRDSLVTSNNHNGKTYFVTTHSSDYNYPGAGAYYCLHDALAAGWVDRDTLSSSANAGSVFHSADPAHNLQDALAACGQSSTAWVLIGLSADINAIEHGNTTFYALNGEPHWLEKSADHDNHFECTNKLPQPNKDIVTYERDKLLGAVPMCAGSFEACTAEKRAQLVQLCNAAGSPCTDLQKFLLAANRHDFDAVSNPKGGAVTCSQSFTACSAQVKSLILQACGQPETCTMRQHQLLSAPTQVAFDNIMNPPAPPPPARSLPGRSNPLGPNAGSLLANATVYHLDAFHKYGAPDLNTKTIILNKNGRMVGYQFSLFLARPASLVGNDGSSVISNDGGTVVSHDGGSMTITMPDGQAFLVSQGGGNLVAQGAGNIVAAGAGNLVASGAGNLVASGAGNYIPSASSLISQDGGGLIAQAAAALVAQGAGNLVAQGAGNLVGNDGSSLVSRAGFEMSVDLASLAPTGAAGMRGLMSVDGPVIYRTLRQAMPACGDAMGVKLGNAHTVFALRQPESYTLLVDVAPAKWKTVPVRGYVCLPKAQAAGWTHVSNP